MSPDTFHLVLIARRVDVRLAVGRGHTYALVLYHSAQAAHGMTLEVGEVYHEVVVLQSRSHEVVLYVGGVAHRYLELAVGVHYLHLGNLGESVFLSHAHVFLCRAAASAVSRVALHDGAVHLLHQRTDERGLQIVGVAGLAGAHFHCHAALCLASERLVYLDERFGRDVARHVNLRLRHCGCRQ